MQTIDVVVVEDELDTLDHLAQLIGAHPRLTVTATATTLAQARACTLAVPPTVLLTDLGLPDGNGTELIREVCDRHPDTLVMVLSALGDEQNVITAIMAGAKGYLLKGDDGEAICDAIVQLVRGASPISAAIARYLLVTLQAGNAPAPPPQQPLLTGRELQVLELVAQGYRSNEIADRLCISYHTVVHHVRNVYDKLAVHSRSQAIYKASQLGLLRPG